MTFNNKNIKFFKLFKSKHRLDYAIRGNNFALLKSETDLFYEQTLSKTNVNIIGSENMSSEYLSFSL